MITSLPQNNTVYKFEQYIVIKVTFGLYYVKKLDLLRGVHIAANSRKEALGIYYAMHKGNGCADFIPVVKGMQRFIRFNKSRTKIGRNTWKLRNYKTA